MIDIKMKLYTVGVELSKRFLDANGIPHPRYYTYAQAAEAEGVNEHAKRFIARIDDGPTVGYGTGLYRDFCIFVNVPRTAMPVAKPGMQRWSYPGWKTDRTAVGVVAHETGHYVEDYLGHAQRMQSSVHGEMWRSLIVRCKKRVTSYEPIPGEAWAETMRLFILNPALLRFGIPERYAFVRMLFQPSELRTWRAVLLDHPDYVAAGKRWIGGVDEGNI